VIVERKARHDRQRLFHQSSGAAEIRCGAAVQPHQDDTRGHGYPVGCRFAMGPGASGGKNLNPAQEELLNQAAQSPVLYNDDMTVKVLQLTRARRSSALADDVQDDRTGIFNCGIVATDAWHQIALLFTGVGRPGENFGAVLLRRSSDLRAPIDMCEGHSRNVPSEFDTLLASCLTHSRRKRVALAESVPE